MKKFIFYVILFILSFRCSTLGLYKSQSYDNRMLSIQTINIFNQRIGSKLTKKSWKGDWLFRRERLDIMDRELRVSRPDIIVFQEVMQKKGSPSESDLNILAKGSLQGYEWDVIKVNEYRDTQEEQFNAIAFDMPIYRPKVEKVMQNFWQLGLDGYLSMTTLSLENEPIFIFNLQMPSSSENQEKIFKFVRDKVKQTVSTYPSCMERVIIAGFIPSFSFINPTFKSFKEELRFKDASDGFCQIESDCYTGTTLNDIFMASYDDQAPAQMDRIFVHRSTVVSVSRIILAQPKEIISSFKKEYGLTKLWPSHRFGWGASIRLARCRQKIIR